MKKNKHIYKVAEHCFEVFFPNNVFHASIKNMIHESYAPFEVDGIKQDTLFSVKLLDNVVTSDVIDCIFTEEQIEKEKGHHSVFTTKEGWLFEQTQPFSEHTNGRVRMDRELKRAEIAVRGNDLQCRFAFNSALMLCYMLATAQHGTILTHSSCVLNDGKAYLFLGKSGTGKSTHSSLWLKHITDTTLLNDDHPILRVNEQGEVIAYGSPWSGKTTCYKNESAQVGGIIRIKRALQNSIQKLNPIQAYASLTTSFSGMTWETNLADIRHSIIEKVIENVPCYTLSCLPDEEAAHVCHAAVANQESKEDVWIK